MTKPIRPKGIESLPQTDFLIHISLQHNVVDLSYFKLLIMLDKIVKASNFKV